MWQGFTIALREGIEAFLIVALILSNLKRTGRIRLARAVYAGTAVSDVTCFGASPDSVPPAWWVWLRRTQPRPPTAKINGRVWAAAAATTPNKRASRSGAWSNSKSCRGQKKCTEHFTRVIRTSA